MDPRSWYCTRPTRTAFRPFQHPHKHDTCDPLQRRSRTSTRAQERPRDQQRAARALRRVAQGRTTSIAVSRDGEEGTAATERRACTCSERPLRWNADQPERQARCVGVRRWARIALALDLWSARFGSVVFDRSKEGGSSAVRPRSLDRLRPLPPRPRGRGERITYNRSANACQAYWC